MTAIRFSEDPGFDFAVRCVLSGVGYGMADPGEALAAAEEVEPGDLDGWYSSWTEFGRRCDDLARAAAAAGHLVSASQASLRAANYRFAGFYYVLGTTKAAEHMAAWQAHRASLRLALSHWTSPVEELAVPWGGHTLRAWRFRSPGDGLRPLLMIHNGMASPLSDVLMTGAADAVMRGWDAVAFDGPGQGHARFVDGIGPTDDWAPVGRSVLDATIAAGGVDEERIASSGISDGGYLAAVHAAADPRVKALVCDPGVVRPVDGALAALPARLRAAWAGGDRELAPVAPDERFALAKLTEQWPGLGPAEVLERLSRRDLAECAHAIACPVFVADPDSAMSFPGQSAALAELLGDRATLVSFASRDGAGLDCEIGAPRLRNQKVFDWLDDVLDVASGRRKENS